MKYCPECGSKRGNNTNLCSCGFQYNKPKKNFFTPNEEDIKKFKEKKCNKRKKYLIINSIISMVSLIIAYIAFHEALPFVAIVGIIIILAALGCQLTNKQYHELVGTQNNSGEHQCVFCGHKGIYRSTPYKTNITECRCSKCKEHLFNE